jgi:tetratricopeptide (TPR) repeat protein/opacity protein-like surface antigen
LASGLFLIVSFSFLVVPALSHAASAELDFAKGVVAFSRGDLKEAESRFRTVLSGQPENAQATYYLAQAVLGLGKTAQAVELFRKAIALRPTHHAIRLDLALALVKMEQFPEAEQALNSVAEDLKDRASLHYYLGFCRYRLERHREAIPELEKARELDQGFASAASYYLGMALFRTGEEDKALQQFQQVAASGEQDRETASMAQRNLALLSTGRQPLAQRKWGAFAMVGTGYDSNVTLDTENRSNAGSITAFLSVGGYYRPLLGQSDMLDLSATFFRSFHTTGETDGYDLTDLSTLAGWVHRFDAGHLLGVSYRFDLDLLDGSQELGMSSFGLYMHAHTGEGRFRIQEARGFATELAYRFRAAWFHSNLDGRDHFRHEFVARQELTLVRDRLWLSVLAGMGVEDARETFFDLWGPLAEVRLRTRLVETLDLWADAGWKREDHWQDQRLDSQWNVGSGLNWQFWEHLAVGLSYRFLDNRSDQDAFRYHRHLVSLVLQGSL